MTTSAVDHRETGLSTCCGQVVSKSAFEAVRIVNQENNRRDSHRTSAASSISDNSAQQPLSGTQTQSQTSKQRRRTMPNASDVPAAQESYINLSKALEMPCFRSMREAQEQQRNRCLAWETKHQDQARAVYVRRKEEVNITFDRERDDMEEQVGIDRISQCLPD